jgi:hypothetical protein
MQLVQLSAQLRLTDNIPPFVLIIPSAFVGLEVVLLGLPPPLGCPLLGLLVLLGQSFLKWSGLPQRWQVLKGLELVCIKEVRKAIVISITRRPDCYQMSQPSSIKCYPTEPDQLSRVLPSWEAIFFLQSF